MVELQGFRGLDEQILVDTSEGRPTYLLVSKSGRHIRLSPNAYHLLRSVYEGRSFESLAERISQSQGRKITPDEVEAAYDHIAGRLADIDQKADDMPTGFWLCLRLIPEAIVARIARPLSIAFQRVIACALLCGILVAAAFMQLNHFLVNIDATSFWIGYGLFLVSSIFHELGHASACVRYGAQPSEIGFAIYWIYPVFYSDVSAAWQLKRWERVVMNLGGTFFQFIVGAVYILIFLLTSWVPARLAFGMILYTSLFSLNPILKFDGYWVVADALGVTNLAQQPGRVFRYLFDRLRGRSATPLPWSVNVTRIVAIYTLISLGFWGYFTLQIAPFVWNTISDYPYYVAGLINHLLTPPHTLSADQVQAFLVTTFTVFIALLMSVNLSRMVIKPLASKVTQLVWEKRGLSSSLTDT